MPEFHSGDVLATTFRGHTRYIRVGGPHPTDKRIYVQDCDAAGYLIGTTGRYLTATHLATRYQLHARPKESYGR